MRSWLTSSLILTAPIALAAAPALAQPVAQSGVSAEIMTDYRERGLSWSDSDPAVRMDATLALGDTFSIEAGAATLRGADRHGGSDLGVTIAPRYSTFAGGWRVSGGLTGHIFVGADDGRGNLDYVELVGEAERTLGPARLAVGAAFAPSQRAIGGSNLNLHADLSVGVPGTPVTAFAGGGHTLGSSNGDPRRARLRPDGDYTDWYLGLEHSRGPLALGVIYTDTTIGRLDMVASPYLEGGAGSRLSGYLRFSL